MKPWYALLCNKFLVQILIPTSISLPWREKPLRGKVSRNSNPMSHSAQARAQLHKQLKKNTSPLYQILVKRTINIFFFPFTPIPHARMFLRHCLHLPFTVTELEWGVGEHKLLSVLNWTSYLCKLSSLEIHQNIANLIVSTAEIKRGTIMGPAMLWVNLHISGLHIFLFFKCHMVTVGSTTTHLIWWQMKACDLGD
jgi:hypothetical protein